MKTVWTPERSARLLELHRSGATRVEMAAFFGVTTDTIAGALYRLNRRGVPLERQSKETKDRRIFAMFKSGRTPSQIAHTLGIKRIDVVRLLDRHGYDTSENPAPYDPVHPMWSMDEDARRKAIAKRAREAARAALGALEGAA